MSHVESNLFAGTVEEFFARFRVVGRRGMLQGPRPDDRFSLAIDGWAAAISVAVTFGLDEQGTRFKDVLLKKKLDPSELEGVLALESMMVLSESTSSSPCGHEHFGSSNPLFLEEFWRRLCGDVRDRHGSAPSQIWRGRPDEIHVRVREPVYCPSPYESETRIASGFYRPSPTEDLVPQSAIFFASRMHRLRELAQRWFKVENKRYVPSHNGQTKRMPRKDEQKSIERDMWMVLLSSSLYLAVATSSDMNRERLGFNAEKWVEMYQEGENRGSAVFGTVEGINGNERFLRAHDHDGRLERWIMEAVGWWVPGPDRTSREEREIVTGALYKWKRELLEMYEQCARRLSEIPGPFDVVPRSQA